MAIVEGVGLRAAIDWSSCRSLQICHWSWFTCTAAKDAAVCQKPCGRTQSACYCFQVFASCVNTRVKSLLLTCRVMCRHEDWIEGLHIGNAGHDATDQRVFSFSADGHVCMWELDAEQNCDVYRVVVSCLCQETYQVSTD